MSGFLLLLEIQITWGERGKNVLNIASVVGYIVTILVVNVVRRIIAVVRMYINE